MLRRRRLTRDEIEERLGTTGGFTIPIRPGRRSGLVWAALLGVIAVLALVGGLPGGGESGVDLKRVLEQFRAVPAATGAAPSRPVMVGRDVQQLWKGEFRRAGVAYRAGKVVVSGRPSKSACGLVVPDNKPLFYCRADARLLVDEGIVYPFLVAHGYAHHVQELLGITEQVRRAVEESPGQAGQLWLEHELQADCFAGVWAHSAYRQLDLASAVTPAPVAAEPDHSVAGGSWRVVRREQRSSWFRRGFESGLPRECNVFAGDGG